KEAAGIVANGLFDPNGGGGSVITGIGGGAGDDADEVVGVALRFHECFTATVGTANEVGIGWFLTIEGADDGFSLDGGFMDSAVGEVDEFFGVTNSPGSVGEEGFVAVV